MTQQTEQGTELLILTSLVGSNDLSQRIIPHLNREFFTEEPYRVAFDLILDYTNTYHQLPQKDQLLTDLTNRSGLPEKVFQDSIELIHKIGSDNAMKFIEGISKDWVVNTTEQFCKDRALYIAIMKSIGMMDKSAKGVNHAEIPKMLQDALSISFDPNIGHDYADDYLERYDFYHSDVERVKTDIHELNKIMKGGFPRKSFSVLCAGTGVGKSLMMSSMAAGMIRDGYNVLYVTLELAQERVAERVDANLMNIELDQLPLLSKEQYIKKMEQVRSKIRGKLIIKEFPTGSMNANKLRALLRELEMKKSFKPDIVFVDYLNICAPNDKKMADNLYMKNKLISEELRGLAMEFDIPIVSATQTNRNGMGNSDVDFSEIGESHGIAVTVDFLAVLMSTETLDQMGQVMLKQLKNRFGDVNSPRKFNLGINRAKMQIYGVSGGSQSSPSNNPQALPSSSKPSFQRPAAKPARVPQKAISNEADDNPPWDITPKVDDIFSKAPVMSDDWDLMAPGGKKSLAKNLDWK